MLRLYFFFHLQYKFSPGNITCGTRLFKLLPYPVCKFTTIIHGVKKLTPIKQQPNTLIKLSSIQKFIESSISKIGGPKILMSKSSRAGNNIFIKKKLLLNSFIVFFKYLNSKSRITLNVKEKYFIALCIIFYN